MNPEATIQIYPTSISTVQDSAKKQHPAVRVFADVGNKDSSVFKKKDDCCGCGGKNCDKKDTEKKYEW